MEAIIYDLVDGNTGEVIATMENEISALEVLTLCHGKHPEWVLCTTPVWVDCDVPAPGEEL